jgi:predicted DNA binding CopG/RHH family protein
MPKQTKLQNSTKTNIKAIPKFKSEAAERKFWEDAANDATEYFDASNMQVAKFTNLKPSTTSISLRLSDSLLDGIRRQANKLDVPYQSLMKVWLTEKLSETSKRN